MKRLFSFLASLKLAVILLVLLLAGLSAGTIIETRQGAEAAGRMVYYSGWFLGLETLFALNVALSIADLFPWARKRTGFVVVHASLLLILAGAATSYFLKVEGSLALQEGERSSAIVEQDAQGTVRARHQLPFEVQLDRFVVDTYPGTMRPSGFRSEVRIIDRAAGRAFPAAIWMNHELHYRGYALFQASYTQEGGHSSTVLSVSRDPGQGLVFTGYLTLLAGLLIVLATRIGQARAGAAREAAVFEAAATTREPDAAASAPEGRGRGAGLLLLLVLLAGSGALRAADPGLDTLRRLPVQHDGRVMPLDTLARESVRAITGSSAWRGEDPAATFSGWLFDPAAAADTPVVQVGSGAFVQALGLPAGRDHASFAELVRMPEVVRLVMQARQAEAQDQPRHGLLQAAEGLDQRLSLMQEILQQQIARPVPAAADPHAVWGLPMAVTAQAFQALMAGPRPAGWPDPGRIDTEVRYNRLHPVRLSWIILAGALALAVLAWRRRSARLDWAAFGLLAGGFAMMTWGIELRWVAGGRIPAANMYESMLFLGWGVGLCAVAAFAVLRNRIVLVNGAFIAALAMLLTDLLPMDAFIHPVAPVLAGTPWLAIHVPIIMVSYAILALGLVAAHMQIGFTIFAPGRQELIERMHEMLYWYILVGSIFLLGGIVTGSMWAASSWGRYWGWDPKEVWSLVAFLAYMAILHARLDRVIGRFGVAAVSIIAFQTILMTYLGVNFVLSTGMHAYAMGDSPVLAWLILAALAEAIFLAAGFLAYRRLINAPSAGWPVPPGRPR
jgi:ABC-type transport system involved in cytochrome c biogenesis permease subunit